MSPEQRVLLPSGDHGTVVSGLQWSQQQFIVQTQHNWIYSSTLYAQSNYSLMNFLSKYFSVTVHVFQFQSTTVKILQASAKLK